MNSEFARIMTLLRKERKISQKKAAEDLGISQGLLSHYEKGKRECGLDFLVRAADYYNVSCDYLLGRSPEPEGKTITVDDLPEDDPAHREKVKPSAVMISFNKKLIVNSLNVLFALLANFRSQTVTKEAAGYIMLSVYKVFRHVFSANSHNDQNFFMINKAVASSACDAAMNIAEARLKAAAMGVALEGEDSAEEDSAPLINTQSLAAEYPQYYSSTVNLIKNSEARIKAVEQAKY